MAPETVPPALFFGLDGEIAVAAARFDEALAGLIKDHGAVRESGTALSCRSGIALPGYYRPSVRWAVGVYSGNVLTAVVWAVTEPWPFLAKNFHLIVGEVVSSATDLRLAFQNGLLGEVEPLACCYICIEDCLESQLAGPGAANLSVVDAAFKGRSYLDIYEAFCRRITASGLYDVACFATGSRTGDGSRVSYPASDLSFSALASNIAEHASRLPE